MKKVILFLLVFLPVFTNAQSNWGKVVWDAYMNSCVSSAKSGMSESMAKSYCTCTAEKLEFRYPDANDLSLVGQEEINELATVCLEEVNSNAKANNKANTKHDPPRPMGTPAKNTNSTAKKEFIGPTKWSQGSYDSFMKTCVESSQATLGLPAARKYCDCSASKLQVMYPDENKVNVTEDEINQIAIECLE